LSRLFIAVPVDRKIRAFAHRVISRLSESGADVKWTELENLHLTLSFLGEVPPEDISKIRRAMEKAVSWYTEFEFELDKAGAFGALERPTAVWLGVGRGAQALTTLTAMLNARLKETDLRLHDDKGRKFSPHLTLGRCRGERYANDLLQTLKTIKIPRGLSCRVEKIILYQSRPSSSGSSYVELAGVPLKADS